MRSGASIIAESIERAVDYKLARSMRPRSKTVTGVYVGKDGEGKAWVRLSGAQAAIPVRRMAVQADVGDTVSVTVGNGRAVVDSNVSNPSASSTTVTKVERRAVVAQETAVKAVDYAVEAQAASAAARASANGAQISAEKAHVAADNAEADAIRAHNAADEAMAEAVLAHSAADSAQESADEAQDSAFIAAVEAARANQAANDAYTQLGEIESVIDTVGWFAEHAVPTSDVEVDPTKTYYTFDDGVYTEVAEPNDEDIATYYELGDTIQNYVASHLALTDDGLYLVMDNAGSRLRLTSDGVRVIDGGGHEVASFTDSGVNFNSSLPQTVGGDEVYLRYYDSNSDAVADALEIRADKVTIGGDDVSLLIGNVDSKADETASMVSSIVEGLTSSSCFTQTQDGFEFTVDSAIDQAMQAADDARRVATDYLAFANGELTVGASGSGVRSVITNSRFSFRTDYGDAAYFGLNNEDIWMMYIDNAAIEDTLSFGDFSWIKRANGNMSLKWVGSDE